MAVMVELAPSTIRAHWPMPWPPRPRAGVSTFGRGHPPGCLERAPQLLVLDNCDTPDTAVPFVDGYAPAAPECTCWRRPVSRWGWRRGSDQRGALAVWPLRSATWPGWPARGRWLLIDRAAAVPGFALTRRMRRPSPSWRRLDGLRRSRSSCAAGAVADARHHPRPVRQRSLVRRWVRTTSPAPSLATRSGGHTSCCAPTSAPCSSSCRCSPAASTGGGGGGVPPRARPGSGRPGRVIDLLAALVDKSMVQLVDREATRYQMLEPAGVRARLAAYDADGGGQLVSTGSCTWPSRRDAASLEPGRPPGPASSTGLRQPPRRTLGPSDL
jgi:hypothetical protein